MKPLRIAISLLVVSACGVGVDSTPPQANDTALGDPATSAIGLDEESVTSPSAPADPERALIQFVSANPGSTASPIIQHACGVYALIDQPDSIRLIKWKSDRWDDFPLDSNGLALDPARSVDVFGTQDLTGDGSPEIAVSWSSPDAPRSFGSIFFAESPSCQWATGSLVDSCGPSFVADSLTFSGQVVEASGFPAACAGRNTTFFEWKDEFGLWLANPYLTFGRPCPPLLEYDDLPLVLCQESWFIRVAQIALRARGYDIEIDGQFGPGTQSAVLGFQKSEGLALTGQIDPSTWNRLNPLQGSDYIDYDGDGVISPKEVAHASGFD